MTACSFAVWAQVCWNWAVRAARTAIPLFIQGRMLSTCRSLDMRRLGSIRRPCWAFGQRLPGWMSNLSSQLEATWQRRCTTERGLVRVATFNIGSWGQTGRFPAYGQSGKSMTVEKRGNVPSVPAFPSRRLFRLRQGHARLCARQLLRIRGLVHRCHRGCRDLNGSGQVQADARPLFARLDVRCFLALDLEYVVDSDL